MDSIKELKDKLNQLEANLKETKNLIERDEARINAKKKDIEELMLEIRYGNKKYDTLYTEARNTYQTLKALELEVEEKIKQKKLNELVALQPDFTFALEKALDDMVEKNKNGMRLTMEDEITTGDVLSRIEHLEETNPMSVEAVSIREAAFHYERIMKDICEASLNNSQLDNAKKTMLDTPVVRLLNMPKIRETLGL